MLLKLGSFFISKKLQKRIKVVTASQLREIIPVEYLHPKWGGTMDISTNFD